MCKIKAIGAQALNVRKYEFYVVFLGIFKEYLNVVFINKLFYTT